MTDFLTFLNTADLQTLTKIPGVTRSIATNIIEARPFDFVEDCAKVRGVGKNLLGRMQSFFEAELNDSRSSAMIPVDEDAMPVPYEKSQPAQENDVEETPSLLSRIGQALVNFFWALVRLIVIIFVIGAIGAAIYFGAPLIYKKFIAPVEVNTAQIHELETEIADLQTQLNEVNARVDAFEETVDGQTASISKLAEMQATLEQETETQNNTVLIALKREIMITRAIETLSRARLYLSQSNFGLARTDVQAARDILVELLIDAPTHQVDALNQIIERLNMALINLPLFPVIAVDDVDIAWQLLMDGLPESDEDVIATFIPETLQTLTPTPTLVPTSEATFEATPTP